MTKIGITQRSRDDKNTDYINNMDFIKNKVFIKNKDFIKNMVDTIKNRNDKKNG